MEVVPEKTTGALKLGAENPGQKAVVFLVGFVIFTDELILLLFASELLNGMNRYTANKFYLCCFHFSLERFFIIP